MAMFSNQATLLVQPSHFGFAGGFVGGMNPQQQFEAQNYFDDLRQQIAQRTTINERRRQANAQQQTADRELSLKEVLANHQMQQDRAASALARGRLGLDSNTASADASNRSTALALQDRLGTMAENRLSAADAAEQAFKNDQLAQQREQFSHGFNNLSAAQQAERDLGQQRLAQERDLHFAPNGGQMLANMLGLKQLASNESMARMQHQTPSGNAMLNESGADRRATMAGTLQRFLHSEASGSDVLREAGADRRATRADATQRFLHETPSGSDVLRDNRTGQELTLREVLEKARLNEDARQFNSVSGNNRFTTEAQKEMHGENLLSEDWWRANRLTQDELDRTSREKITADEIKNRNRNALLEFFSRLQSVDSETMDGIRGQAQKEFGSNQPLLTPRERAERQLFNDQVLEAQQGVTKTPKTLQDVTKMNQAAAGTLLDQHLNQKRSLSDVLKDARESDRNSPASAAVTEQTLMQLLQDYQATQRRQAESNPFSPLYKSSRERGTGIWK